MGGIVRPNSKSSRALVRWMGEADLSTDDLAAIVGVVPWTIQAWRRGVAPSMKNATRLSKMSKGAVAVDGWL